MGAAQVARPAARDEAPAPIPWTGAGPLLEAVAREANLYRAWAVVALNAERSPGGPSPEAADLAEHLSAELEAMRTALLDGSYRPQRLRPVAIPKPDGRQRQLRIPSLRDRIVERAILQVLGLRLDALFTPWSFGYRPGLSTADAVRAVVDLREEGATHVVRADFRDCFDSISRTRLLRCLRHSTDDVSVIRLVASLLERRNIGDPAASIDGGDGVAQGAPLSPLLCNLYLNRFDEAVLARGVNLVRYADDLTAVAGDQRGAERALEVITQVAGRLGLSLAEEKGYVTSFKEGFDFVGWEVSDGLPPREDLTDRPTPERKVVYVGRQGAHVYVKNGQLRVNHGDELLLTVPFTQVEQLVTFGSVGISAGMRDQALARQVEVTLCSRRGSFQGRIQGVTTGGVLLRREQYRRADSPSFRLALARGFVEGKVANQRALLLRYSRRTNAGVLGPAARRLSRLRHAAMGASTINVLRGIEGRAARVYFETWRDILPNTSGFRTRNRRPPRDPVNAALSYAYAVVLGSVTAALASAGLDYQVGFLHDDEDGRPSLGLDLMEEFRPLIVDTVVIESFRRRTLTAEHFIREGAQWRFTDPARRQFLGVIEERLLTRSSHVPSGQRSSYRRAMFLQARQIASLVRGSSADYQPVRWR